jgi:ribosomal protein S18 acetylase RimI-like enzyme
VTLRSPRQQHPFSLDGYGLQIGNHHDLGKLVQFMALAYGEQGDDCRSQALTQTVQTHYVADAPLWWVVPEATPTTPIACLWLGNAIDPHQGDRYGCILLLYVIPAHRRRGIATALLRQAQTWAIARGDLRLGLQVSVDNGAALALYQKLGYTTQALWMTQPLP